MSEDACRVFINKRRITLASVSLRLLDTNNYKQKKVHSFAQGIIIMEFVKTSWNDLL